MKRPAGLILSAIALGFVALGLLLGAALIGFSLYLIKTHPATRPVPPGTVSSLVALAVVLLACAAWAISTLIGLLFLRPWARNSIIAIGGLTAVWGAVSCVGCIAVALFGPKLIPATSHQAGAVHVMWAIMLGIGFFYAVLATIGTTWIIYFTRLATRQIFVPRDRIDPATGLPLPQLPASRRPIVITMLGVLFLIGAASCLFLAFQPTPAFFFGVILTGVGEHLSYGCLAIINLVIGIFLLRLHPAARLATIAFLGMGCVNILLSLLPWYQRQMQAFLQLRLALQPPPPNLSLPVIRHITTEILPYVSAFNLIVYGLLFWLLHRYRTAFNPPPAIPSFTEPL
ncbi:MAG: hypothetical protein ABI197_13995 [Granulicella sp.]